MTSRIARIKQFVTSRSARIQQFVTSRAARIQQPMTSRVRVSAESDAEDDQHAPLTDTRAARGRRPVFECFWNGRLIPYTNIDESVTIYCC